jgi:NAD(P)-dependent dehydrogenase (short-subunit alcohol dehydrogenase family)
MLLKDQIAFVTGSGRGIGRAIAQLFAKECAAVFLTARTETQLSATAAEIAQDGGGVEYLAADLAIESDCRAAFDKALTSFGRIDILVNNGGHYGPVVPVEEYPMEEFDRVMAVHLRAPFLLSQLALPGMYERQRGVILNIFSEGGVQLGLGVCGGKSRVAGLDSLQRGGSGPQRRASERNLSWTGDRNRNEQGTGSATGAQVEYQ